MGLVADTSFIINAERARISVQQMLLGVAEEWGDTELAISVITVAELVHGVERARTPQQHHRRQTFLDDLVQAVQVHEVNLAVANRAGRILAQEARRGITIPFADLLIGATALELGFDVLTENVRDFQKIPGLAIQTPGRG